MNLYRWAWILELSVLAMAPSLSYAAAPGVSPGRTQTTVERMTMPRLAALHADVEAIKAKRKDVELKLGLNDYHCILHAHGEDSQHTAGTRAEMLADAKKVGVNCIMLTDHYRPPRDFIDGTWRGLYEGVLFIPGSETHDCLIYPDRSIMDKMELPKPEFIKAVTEGEGLIFLSHLESKVGHSMDGLTGTEIYNNHYDAMDDAAMMMGLIQKILDPKAAAELQAGLDQYPAELYAALVDYPQLYLKRWDAETQKQRLVGIAANDCHHNQVYIVKLLDAENVGVGTIVDPDDGLRKMPLAPRPALAEMAKGKKPGDILIRLDFDPYFRSFLNCSTHIYAPELTEAAIRSALKAGHAYVSHDWLCTPTGFAFAAMKDGKITGIMGDEVPAADAPKLVAEFPNECEIRIIKNGALFKSERGRKIEVAPDGPGVYRVEGWLDADGEQRAWIYCNPIYVR